MRTAEKIKAEIEHLQQELRVAEVTDEFVQMVEACKSTGGKHEWRIREWEKHVDHQPIYSWGRAAPVFFHQGSERLKAKLDCHCGARVTYEDGQ